MLIDLPPSYAMALCDILLTHVQLIDRTQVFIDVVRNKETRVEDLLTYFVNVAGGAHAWPHDDSDRQLLMLALALAALDRPGMDAALRGIAGQIRGGQPGERDGTVLFDEFKRLNADRFAAMRPRPLA